MISAIALMKNELIQMGALCEEAISLAAKALTGQDDLRDIGRLVSDALHIRDDLQRGGDLPQVTGHRLLLERGKEHDFLRRR